MIISYSGKKRSGKDTAGIITQTLLSFPQADNETVLKYLKDSMDNPKWKIKKWAGYLKQIVAILVNRKVEELEDEDVKNFVMYKRWRFTDKFLNITKEYDTVEEGLEVFNKVKTSYQLNGQKDQDDIANNVTYEEVDITIRNYLERIGTEMGRNIHSNLWIDRLMIDYYNDLYNPTLCQWIITDTRFPNEADRVTKENGINIRINRVQATKINAFNVDGKDYDVLDIKNDGKSIYFVVDEDGSFIRDYDCIILEPVPSTHESETALDRYPHFDEFIDNNSTLNDFINEIRFILTKHKLI